ncbi:MAG TPA: hypothetical protein VFI70_01800 [Nitrososphaeraceae archaeon]|nr:hypothetical protein [Nitrososphaeraceae archaeon]
MDIYRYTIFIINGHDVDRSCRVSSLEEIAEMDKQRSQAIESLEISGNSVKCFVV